MSAVKVEHIGDATLYLGDCRDVIQQIGHVDAIVTDPPYGVGFTGNRTKYTDNSGRADVYEDTPEYFNEVVVPAIKIALSISDRAAVFCGVRRLTEYPVPADIGGVICPNGGGMSPWGFGCYHPILFYGKSPYLAKKLGSRPTAVAIYQPGLHVTGESKGNNHPCPKPESFMCWAVGTASLPGDTVLDCFMGSGTTGVAAVRLGRKFIGVEIDPRWFDIACRRIETESRQGRLFDGAA